MDIISKFKEWPWYKWPILLVSSFFVFIMLFWFSVYAGLWGKLPTQAELKDIKQAEASLILDSKDKLLGKYFIFDRQVVQYDDLPEHLIHALVSTEDVRFYDHKGVDYRSFFRVFFKSLLLQDDSSGGGSTISQQLVKNLYGRDDYGMFSMPVNKVKEMIVAKRIEKVYTKEEILSLYFNTVPFSDNTYGIESAARKFYNTTAKELTLSQSATLVGTLKASHSYNPRLFPERSQLRRDVVLQQMEKYGFITDQIEETVHSDGLNINYRDFDHNEGLAPYFREKLRLDVSKLFDSIKKPDGTDYNIYKDGLRIYTTLDYQLQEYAENAVTQHMAKLQGQFEKAYGKNGPWNSDKFIDKQIKNLPSYKKLKAKGKTDDEILTALSKKKETPLFSWKGDTIQNLSTLDSLKHYMKYLNTGFLAVDPSTGAIKSYVGGINFEHFKYDHISMGKRQVGSTFKPFVYTAAIESGMHPCSYFPVKPVTYADKNDWTPTNSSTIENEDHINYSLENALSNSVNTIAVKVLKEVRIDPVIELAHKMGVNSDIPKVPSIALGTAELSLMELITAYTTFANDGRPSEPYFIEKIEDKNGVVLYERPKPKKIRPAFNEYTREVMVEIMKSTINSGTARRIRSTYGLQNDMAGKTGTTQDNRDGWFVGITPNLVMGSWVGHDDHRIGFKSTSIGQGANSALPIVALYLQQINSDDEYKSLANARFKRPSDQVLADLECEPEQEDGFFQKLFGSDRPERDFARERRARDREEKKKKKGFFSFLKKKKN